MSAIARGLELVGVAGGVVYWLEKAFAYARRRRFYARAVSARGPIAQGAEVGICSSCGRPRLAPGMKAPEYLAVCACPRPSAVEAAAAARSPRPQP